MKIVSTIGGQDYIVAIDKATSLAIPITFSDEQVNLLSVPSAQATALVYDESVAAIKLGGPCNVDVLTIIPHCHGTHTESVGHIVLQPVSVADCPIANFIPLTIITVLPRAGDHSSESYHLPLHSTDRVITRTLLEQALQHVRHTDFLQSVALRTLPNDERKKTGHYTSDNKSTPFFTHEAMHFFNACHVQHLLVDLPSIDKIKDQGKLSNHHIFWQVALDSCQLTDNTLREKTLTELIYIPNTLSDGHYLLNLQCPALQTDAVPSQPIVLPLQETTC